MTDITMVKLGKTWAPADVLYGIIPSKLLQFTGFERRQCCVGVAMTRLGAPDAWIWDCEDIVTANVRYNTPPFVQARIDEVVVPEDIARRYWFDNRLEVLRDRSFRNDTMMALFSINDRNPSVSRQQRVADLNQICELGQVNVRFELSA